MNVDEKEENFANTSLVNMKLVFDNFKYDQDVRKIEYHFSMYYYKTILINTR